MLQKVESIFRKILFSLLYFEKVPGILDLCWNKDDDPKKN